jgi:hypothetical protein
MSFEKLALTQNHIPSTLSLISAALFAKAHSATPSNPASQSGSRHPSISSSFNSSRLLEFVSQLEGGKTGGGGEEKRETRDSYDFLALT